MSTLAGRHLHNAHITDRETEAREVTQAGSSSVAELGFGVQIICLQMVALELHGLCEATDKLFTSLTSAAGVRRTPRSDH